MRVLLRSFTTGCLLLVFTVSAGAQATKVSLDSLVGDWLNRDYVEALNKTKSPLASLTNRYSSMTFAKIGQSYWWGVEANFHTPERSNEVVGLKPTGEAGTYAFEYSAVQRGSTIQRDDLIVYPDGSPDGIAWVGFESGEKQRIHFIRVRPTMELYVNHVALAGDYTDWKGQKFRFTDDCRAEWPDTTFTYRIGLDHVFNECDYLRTGDARTNTLLEYAFQWNGGKLYLYNVVSFGPEIKQLSGPTLHILTPVKK
jgi:hypothetical protein